MNLQQSGRTEVGAAEGAQAQARRRVLWGLMAVMLVAVLAIGGGLLVGHRMQRGLNAIDGDRAEAMTGAGNAASNPAAGNRLDVADQSAQLTHKNPLRGSPPAPAPVAPASTVIADVGTPPAVATAPSAPSNSSADGSSWSMVPARPAEPVRRVGPETQGFPTAPEAGIRPDANADAGAEADWRWERRQRRRARRAEDIANDPSIPTLRLRPQEADWR